MNYRNVISRFGLLLVVLSAIMIFVAALYFAVQLPLRHTVDRHAAYALFISGGIGLVIGFSLWVPLRKGSAFMGRREALLLVAMSWLGGAAFSALPYQLWALLHFGPDGHPFRTYDNCYFEAMSGLTTTGATVLTDIEAMPLSLLLWRGMTHWLGGLGIIVLFVAVLPSLGVGGKKLFRVEAPGPDPEGLRPQIRESARILFFIYCGLTVAQTLLLWILTPMTFHDSLTHTFGTLATGGFSPKNASVGAYFPSLTTDVIIILFMVMAGANFGLYYQLIRGRVKNVFRDTEMRVYLSMLGIATVIIAWSLWMQGDPIVVSNGQTIAASGGESLRHGAFQAVSIQTTTGFVTADFNQWPFLARAALIMLMFVGGCAGSTGGGIKVIRIWIAFKVMVSEIEHVFRPNVIRPVRLGRTTIDEELKLGTLAYIIGIVALFTLGSGAIMMIEQTWGDAERCTYETAATASLATLCTIGPGLGAVGAVENYGWFCPTSKWLMCVLMALGRLEVFAIIVLFTPRFWKGD